MTFTRTLALLGLVIGIGCGGGKDDDSTRPTTTTTGTPGGTTSAGTAAGASTTTGTLPAAEDCDDGADNDLDALIDCEDPDCFTDAACFESDCGNGVDDDNDQLTDCVDEDCWGNGCEVTIATLSGMSLAMTNQRYSYQTAFGSAACAASQYDMTIDIWLEQPYGTVRHLPASGGTWTTCAWSADQSGITASSSYFLYNNTPRPVWRNGFTIESGCAVQTSGFLPDQWTIQKGAQVQFRTRPTGNGPAWWTLDQSGSYNALSSYGSSVVPGSPCSTRISWSSYGASVFDVFPASDYVLAGPP